MFPRHKIPWALWYQVLESYFPMALCCHILGSYGPKTLCSQGPLVPSSRVLSSQDLKFPGPYVPRAPCCQVLVFASNLGSQTGNIGLNSALILTSILSPSVLAFPPNHSLVSLPASSLPPPSIPVFILAPQSGQTGWPSALQSIIIVVFDTYNLRQKTLSLRHAPFLYPPPTPGLLYLYWSPVFSSQRMPDVGLIHICAPSTSTPRSCWEYSPSINPFLSPFSTPLPWNRQALYIYLTIALISTAPPHHSPLYPHILWSIALTTQINNSSSQTFVRLQCIVVFFLTV